MASSCGIDQLDRNPQRGINHEGIANVFNQASVRLLALEMARIWLRILAGKDGFFPMSMGGICPAFAPQDGAPGHNGERCPFYQDQTLSFHVAQAQPVIYIE